MIQIIIANFSSVLLYGFTPVPTPDQTPTPTIYLDLPYVTPTSSIEPTPFMQDVFCATDYFDCGNGIFAYRNPRNNCEFDDCPPPPIEITPTPTPTNLTPTPNPTTPTPSVLPPTPTSMDDTDYGDGGVEITPTSVMVNSCPSDVKICADGSVVEIQKYWGIVNLFVLHLTSCLLLLLHQLI